MKKKVATLLLISLLTGCSFNKYTPGEKALFLCMAGGMAGDYLTTKQNLNRPGAKEYNPLLSDHPSDSDLILIKGGEILLFTTLAEVFHEHRKTILGIGCFFGAGAIVFNLDQAKKRGR